MWAVALAALCTPMVATNAPTPIDGRIAGESLTAGPWAGALGIRMTTAALMALDRSGEPREETPINLFRTPSTSQVESGRAVPRPSTEDLSGAAGTALPTAQHVGLSFNVMVGTAVPDNIGAVGPTQFLSVLNHGLKTFDKRTGAPDGVLNLGLSTFFQPVLLPGTSAFDPNVKFDRLSGRWFVTAATFSPRFVLAVSAGGTVTSNTAWTFFYIAQDQVPPVGDAGCVTDMPQVGIDVNALYVSMGLLSPCNRGAALVIRKSSVLGDGPVVVSVFRNVTLGTAMDNFDSTATQGYFFDGWARFHRVADPAGIPSISFIPITGNSAMEASVGVPFAIRHKGNNLETGSTGVYNRADWVGRMWTASASGAPIRNGHAWLYRVVGVDNNGVGHPGTSDPSLNSRTALLWAEFAGLNTSAATVARWGVVYAPSAVNDVHQRNYWLPSLMVSGQGHLVLGSSAAGTNEYINAAVAGVLAGDAAGTFRVPELFAASGSAYNGPTDPSRFNMRRWGDYSATSLDPCDDMTVWTIQQFAAAPDQWGVQVAKFLAPPPPSVWSIAPRVLPRGNASINVTITGTPANGEGFYDPGL